MGLLLCFYGIQIQDACSRIYNAWNISKFINASFQTRCAIASSSSGRRGRGNYRICVSSQKSRISTEKLLGADSKDSLFESLDLFRQSIHALLSMSKWLGFHRLWL